MSVDAKVQGLQDAAPGQRILLGTVAARLNVSFTVMAAHLGISKAAVANLVCSNTWPARADANAIKAQLRELLAERGATDDELAGLFAHPVRRTRDSTQDRYGRARPTQATPNEEGHDMLIGKQVLAPHAKRHFKLLANPFDGKVLRDEQMFDGDDVRYVREAAWQCATNSSFVAICGESGSGKTTILEDLEERLAAQRAGVVVIRPSVLGMAQFESQGHRLRSADILQAICQALAPDQPVPPSDQARKARANKLLQQSAGAGNRNLVLIEEAHDMPDATLKHLKRLHELHVGRQPLVGILLLAQPELKKRLRDGLSSGSLREVAQRCEVVELLPLDGELRSYLQVRCAAMNVRLDSIVADDRALDAVRARLMTSDRKKSLCYPLAVHNLLTLAMNKAAELGVPTVTADIVAQA